MGPQSKNVSHGGLLSLKGVKLTLRSPKSKYQPQNEADEAKETVKVISGRDSYGHKTINQYVILRPLGIGAYGKVKLCQNLDDKQFYAAKQFKKSTLMRKRVGMKRGAAFEDVLREISIMKKLSHKNVIQLYEVINDPSDDRLYMILEYAEKGPIMKGEVEQFTAIPEDIAKKYFCDVLDGLEYLHSLKVIHRDIKPENLLVTSDGTAKISDFGVSLILDNEDDEALKRTVGSPAFLAPELCSDQNVKVIGSAIDIWGLGASLYCFIFGSLPFTGETEMQMYDSIRNHEVTFPHQIDFELQDLITKMLTKDPAKRITLPEIKEHSWILGKNMTEGNCKMDSSDGSITMET